MADENAATQVRDDRIALFFRRSLVYSVILVKAPPPPALRALLEFLREHAGDHGDGVLDAAAMAQLNDELVPAALAAWPDLQQVLESTLESWWHVAVFRWTVAGGFQAPLSHEQVFALTQLVMLQVGPLIIFAAALQSYFYKAALVCRRWPSRLSMLLVHLRSAFRISFSFNSPCTGRVCNAFISSLLLFSCSFSCLVSLVL